MNKVQIVIASLKLLELELKEKTSKLLELELKEQIAEQTFREETPPPKENTQSTSSASDSFDMSQFDPMYIPFVESILLMEKMNSLDNNNGIENARKDSENIIEYDKECIVVCKFIGAGSDENHAQNARAHIEQQGGDTESDKECIGKVVVNHENHARVHIEQQGDDAENDKECIGKVVVNHENHAQNAKECDDKHAHSDSGENDVDDAVKENVSPQSPTKKRKAPSQLQSQSQYGPDETRIDKRTASQIEWGNKSFDERCKDLLSYKQEFGDFDVSRNYDANPQLGIWVMNMRHRCKTLSPENIGKLKEIGFEFHGPNHNSRFSLMVRNLRAFKEKHGHCDVPADVALGKWCSKLRLDYHYIQKKAVGNVKGQRQILNQNRIKQLDKLGFVWNTKE